MTTFPFSTMSQDQANSFSVEVDFVDFSSVAAAVRVRDFGSGFDLTAQGKTLTFPFSPDRIAYDNFIFVDGSQFLVGDADIQTFADPTSNLINGTSGSDFVLGRAGDDEIDGKGGADLIYGNEGADRVSGNSGADTIFGGRGGDRVNYAGASEGVLVYGNLEGDTLIGGGGADTLFGGSDNDSLSGGSGRDMLIGGVGNDTIEGGVGSDLIYGNDGDDRFTYDPSTGPADRDTVYGGAGSDFLNYTAVGMSFGTLAYGNIGRDDLFGGGGSDSLFGNEDSDAILGGGGSDLLHGGQGDDFLAGQGGDDFLVGGVGNDQIFARLPSEFNEARAFDVGSDIIIGGAGDDIISYAVARDAQYAQGNEGNDAIVGSSYATLGDIIYGNTGDDALNGGGGADTLYGGAGNDDLTNSIGAINSATGQPVVGDAMLVGGLGADQIVGLFRSETSQVVREQFVFGARDSGFVRSEELNTDVSDSVIGFDTGLDKIVIGVAGTSGNFASLTAASHGAAQQAAQDAIAAGKTLAFVAAPFFGFPSGYLFWDSNNDRVVDFEIGIGPELVASDIV